MSNDDNNGVILDAVRRAANDEAEAKRVRDEAAADLWQQAEALLPEARAILGPLADEADVTVVAADQPVRVTFRVAPHVWRGWVVFDLYLYPGTRWQWQFVTEGDGGHPYIQSSADWSRPPLTNKLASLHRRYEDLIEVKADSLRDSLVIAKTEEDAAEQHAALVALAPERAAEWDQVLAAWRALFEKKRVAAVEREEDFAAYLRDLQAWRKKYEETLAINRAEAVMLQQEYDAPFTRHEVAFVAAPAADDDDADGVPHVFTVWAARGEMDEFGYWSIYAGGGIVRRRLTRVLWVGEGIVTRAAETPGPWRFSVWVEPAGQWVHCPHEAPAACKWLAAEATGNRFTPLPEEPSVTDYGEVFANGLTDYERGRIHEVIGDMQLAGVPF